MRFVILIISILSFSAHASQHPKIGFSLEPFMAKAVGTTQILVILQEQAKLDDVKNLATRAERLRMTYDRLRSTARESQAGLNEWLDKRGLNYRGFYIRNMVLVEEATSETIRELAERADVSRIIADPEIREKIPHGDRAMTLSEYFSPFAIGPNIINTGADRVWSEFGTTGGNIIVAGQDTGVDWTHPALVRQYRGNNKQTLTVDHTYSWHDAIRKPIQKNRRNVCGYNISVPCDDDQHGTHTMGTVVGADTVGNQIGMAPGAEWIACRNMDAGVGRPSTYIECFEFFLAPFPQNGNAMEDGDPLKAPHVMNNSWGCPASELCEGNEFLPVLEALKTAGVMVVASAGNDGPSCSTIESAPAHHSALTFSVGALNHVNGNIASFSSRGPSAYDLAIGPDLSAPGVNVRSAVPGGSYQGAGWSGTSMAGPHVVGAVALMWSARPELIGKIDATAELLRKNAVPKTSTQTCGGVSGSSVPNNTFGHGQLNVYNALKASFTN